MTAIRTISRPHASPAPAPADLWAEFCRTLDQRIEALRADGDSAWKTLDLPIEVLPTRPAPKVKGACGGCGRGVARGRAHCSMRCYARDKVVPRVAIHCLCGRVFEVREKEAVTRRYCSQSCGSRYRWRRSA